MKTSLAVLAMLLVGATDARHHQKHTHRVAHGLSNLLYTQARGDDFDDLEIGQYSQVVRNQADDFKTLG